MLYVLYIYICVCVLLIYLLCYRVVNHVVCMICLRRGSEPRSWGRRLTSSSISSMVSPIFIPAQVTLNYSSSSQARVGHAMSMSACESSCHCSKWCVLVVNTCRLRMSFPSGNIFLELAFTASGQPTCLWAEKKHSRKMAFITMVEPSATVLTLKEKKARIDV